MGVGLRKVPSKILLINGDPQKVADSFICDQRELEQLIF